MHAYDLIIYDLKAHFIAALIYSLSFPFVSKKNHNKVLVRSDCDWQQEHGDVDFMYIINVIIEKEY